MSTHTYLPATYDCWEHALNGFCSHQECAQIEQMSEEAKEILWAELLREAVRTA